MNKVMKLTSLVLVLVVIMGLLSGCRNKNLEDANSTSTVETRMVIDAVGREVEIPKQVKTVIPLANALRMMCYAGAQDMVVGVETNEQERTIFKAYNWVNYEAWKDLPAVGEGGSGAYTPYLEEIVKLKPDVIICGYTKENAEELQEKTGIPVVVINQMKLFGDDYDESLRIIGKVCQTEERCQQVIDYIQSVEDDVKARTQDIKAEDQPSVYFGAMRYKGGHGIEGTYQNFQPAVVANIKNAYVGENDQAIGVTLDMEKVLELNADVIFLDSSDLDYVRENFKDYPDYMASLQAVQKDQVYTLLGYNWYFENIEIAMLDCYYMGSVVYPDQFSDVDIEAKAKEIFDFMLGDGGYYQDLVDAGYGYQKYRN